MRKFPHLFVWLISIGIATFPAHAQTPVESDGTVVIEVESQDPGLRFAFESDIPGYKGSGYFRGKTDSFNTGGLSKISYPFRITTSSTYQFAFRSRIGSGDSNTDSNDTFIRLVDSEGNPVVPVANENVTHSGSWYKVYMNTANVWSHQASNKDNDPHSLSWILETGNLYALEMSVRSKNHLVDRLILWDRERLNLANKVTGKGPNEAAFNALEPYSEWAGYPVHEQDGQSWADTGGFMGWLEISASPYVYIQALNGWIFYNEENAAQEKGSWAYFYK